MHSFFRLTIQGTPLRDRTFNSTFEVNSFSKNKLRPRISAHSRIRLEAYQVSSYLPTAWQHSSQEPTREGRAVLQLPELSTKQPHQAPSIRSSASLREKFQWHFSSLWTGKHSPMMGCFLRDHHMPVSIKIEAFSDLQNGIAQKCPTVVCSAETSGPVFTQMIRR